MEFVYSAICCAIVFIILYVFSWLIDINDVTKPKKDIFSGGEAGDIIIERSNGMKEKIMKVCMKVQGEWVEMPNVEGVLQTDENGCIIGSYIRKKKNKEEKNMREIKAGDKVKVTGIIHEDKDSCPIVGDIYTVMGIRTCPFSGSNYAVFKETDFKGLPLTCYLFNCELVNKKEKEIFTKEQLKDGDIVILRNGWETVVDIKNRALLYKDDALMISGYNENLTSKFGHNWDIMKVKRQTLLYNREKQTEMTLEEVCKELGRDIKIVKEH